MDLIRKWVKPNLGSKTADDLQVLSGKRGTLDQKTDLLESELAGRERNAN